MTRWFHAPLRWRETKRHRHYLGGKYQLVREIGQGASGIVHLAIDIKTNKRYAIKELNKSRLERQFQSDLLWQSGPRRQRTSSEESMLGIKKRKLNESTMVIEEIEILKQLPRHKNIIQFIEVLQDPAYEDSIFIVTEIAEKGIIMDIVPNSICEPYSNEQCRHIFKQLVDAIDHLHTHGILHGDIKLQNLLVSSDNHVKLIDFGNATHITDMPRKTNSSVGSPAFMAPELLKKVNKDSIEYSPTCADLWSMGITLYCLAYGQLPFEKSNILDLYHTIQNDPVVHSTRIDPMLCDLIDKLLAKNPKDRITMDMLKSHSWMQAS